MEAVGPYRVVKELGRGAMGVVFEAFDPAIGRTVAIKVIRSHQLATAEEDAQLKLRFAREASAAGRLSHPNIVTVYQLGEHDGLQYLVMEFITGVSLESMLVPMVPLNLDTTLGILTQIASALDYAHGAGIVHRDIKPANILVKADGTVKLTDFGIAHISSQTITQTGFTMGTPAYMAPEQIMASRVDGRADQYSLAVVAYQMLSGKRPFEAPTDQALMFKIVSEEPRPLDEVNMLVPQPVGEVIRRGLSKHPDQRYRNCSEFVAEMRTAAAPEPLAVLSSELPLTVEPPRYPGPPPSSRARRPRISVVAACALLVAVVAAWFSFNAGPKVRRKQENAAVIPVTTPGTNPNPVPSQPVAVEPPPNPHVASAPDSPPAPSPELHRAIMAALDLMTDTDMMTDEWAPGDRANRPIQLFGLTSALNKGGAALVPEIGTAVKRRGVDFQLNSQSRAVLRLSGATDSLLEIIGTSYHPPAVTLPPKPVSVAPKPVKLVLQAGATKVNEKDGLKYVWIPPGTFQMGCSQSDNDCDSDEVPRHLVTITKDFWMGQTPVTQEAYQRVVGSNPSYAKGARLPVERVTWPEAQSYCQAVGMRLPTEAEYEYAARGGSTGSRYGDVDQIAWYAKNSGKETHEVGLKQANAWGLHDVLGNVWEWVADWFAPSYPAGSQRDPTGPAKAGIYKVLRGGSCGNLTVVRASSRGSSEPMSRDRNVGFRCAGN